MYVGSYLIYFQSYCSSGMASMAVYRKGEPLVPTGQSQSDAGDKG